VAGTCARGPDALSDDRLADRLLASDKNRREHDIVGRRRELGHDRHARRHFRPGHEPREPADFRQDFELNLIGAVRFLQACQSRLQGIDGQPASVVLFSTIAVSQGLPMHASVAASKGAVEGLVRSLAAEWAPKIRVNAIAPALTDTPLAGRLLSSPEKREAMAARYPLKRIGTAADVAAMARFLLSAESSWMTGQVLGVDGGMSTLRV
jgi:NAD(P)-dependent dehydrogenase (short-subunit alcohol dehydrogenase family)